MTLKRRRLDVVTTSRPITRLDTINILTMKIRMYWSV